MHALTAMRAWVPVFNSHSRKERSFYCCDIHDFGDCSERPNRTAANPIGIWRSKFLAIGTDALFIELDTQMTLAGPIQLRVLINRY